MRKEKELDLQITLSDEAEKIKKKHRQSKVYLIEVFGDEEDEKEVYRAWIRKPNLQEFSAFTSMAAKSEVIPGGKVIINSCFLEGDEEIKNDDDIFLGAVNQLEELLKVRSATIKKF
ncbi:MAG: hypothetical protein AAF620_00280 [Bacteroidota bacterium]